mmetsp:Transcript_3641/g.11682  ORF Transcript_3641/g.11682 Transcript_3641/m.11682 type:complete len:272 (-) Transcript_3641:47-862(-)
MSPDPHEETSPIARGPPAARSLLWESVLKRSLLSGDVDRLEAAISLAERGGANKDVLDDARRQLCILATASLAHARQGGDATVLSAAIDRAEELRGEASELREARQELRRLARTRLQSAVSSRDEAELEAALRLAAAAREPNAGLIASAQRLLRELREPVAPPRPSEHCVLEVAEQADSPKDASRRAASPGPRASLQKGPRPGKQPVDAAQVGIVPPTLFGRQSLGDDGLLEAGLRKQSVHKVVPGGAQHSGTQRQKAGVPGPDAQECSLQ